MLPPRVILAAVDFSEPSRVALGCAARLARHTGAALHVLHAEDQMLAAAARHAGVDLAGETRDELKAFTRAALPPGDWAPVYHVVGGNGVEVICDIARRERADVIVVGMHGMSGAERGGAPGSIAYRVLTTAEVPLLMYLPRD
jgi:nucleotide-binding universal stress UspA family protein